MPRTLLALLLSSAALCAIGCNTLDVRDGDEETWAIRCAAANGARRQQVANQYADVLRKVNGLKPELVQVVDDEGEAIIYYGRYQRYFDTTRKADWYQPDHTKDLELIRNLYENRGGRDAWPFLMASMETLPSKSTLDPSWNFENASGHWSLHVAVFYNTENMRRRRFAAEEYCKMLRSQGVEAYFHHGEENSSVYVGMFPESAVVEIREQDKITGAVQARFRIVDKRMLETQQKFPYVTHNGYLYKEVIRDRETNTAKKEPYPTFPAMTPRAERGDLPTSGSRVAPRKRQ